MGLFASHQTIHGRVRKYWSGQRDVTEINSHIIGEAERPTAKRMSSPKARNMTVLRYLITQNDLIFESAEIDIEVAFACFNAARGKTVTSEDIESLSTDLC